DGKWIEEGRVEGAGYEARSLFEEPNGTLWMGTSNDGALRLTLGETSQTGQRPAIHVDHFTGKDGLPKGSVTVTDVRGVPLFTGGLDDPRAMHFDASAGRFVRDTALDGVVGVNLNVNGGFLVADPQGRVFLNLGRETAVLQQRPDHTWSVDKTTFARFGSTPVGGLFLDGDIVWLQ